MPLAAAQVLSWRRSRPKAVRRGAAGDWQLVLRLQLHPWPRTSSRFLLASTGTLGNNRRLCQENSASKDTLMAISDEPVQDVFLPGGQLRSELLEPGAADALEQALRLARETCWDRVRSPHVFMGLLAGTDDSVHGWGERLGADLERLLGQFQELFQQEGGDSETVLALNREFVSDNVIRLLREACQRARENARARITPMDLLIVLL